MICRQATEGYGNLEFYDANCFICKVGGQEARRELSGEILSAIIIA